MARRPVIRKGDGLLAIVDELLPWPRFEELFRYCNGAEYSSVHADRVQKVWRLGDGFPLRGATCRYRAGVPAAASGDLPGPLAGFVEAVLDVLPEVSDVVGSPVADWQELTLTPWVYPLGAGLSLHQDTGRTGPRHSYTGSFTFYVNPTWNIHWGGWLLVLDEARAGGAVRARPAEAPVVSPPWLGDELEAGLVGTADLATAVLPAPNRIAFISPRARHLITRVDPNAGQHARISVAGFFLHEEPGPRKDADGRH